MKTEEILNDLLRVYHETVVEMKNDCRNVDEEIARWTEIRDSFAKPYQDKLAELEAQMRLPMLDRQSSFICSFGKINFRKGATRRSYNLDALDALANHDAYIKDKIWAFRTESVGEPSITVKLAEPGK